MQRPELGMGQPGVHAGASSVFGEGPLKCDVSCSGLFRGPPGSSTRSSGCSGGDQIGQGEGQKGGGCVLGEEQPWGWGAGGSQGHLGPGRGREGVRQDDFGVSNWVGGTPFNRGGKSRGGGSRSDGRKAPSLVSGSLGDNPQRPERRDSRGEAVELPGFLTQGVSPQPPQM